MAYVRTLQVSLLSVLLLHTLFLTTAPESQLFPISCHHYREQSERTIDETVFSYFLTYCYTEHPILTHFALNPGFRDENTKLTPPRLAYSRESALTFMARYV